MDSAHADTILHAFEDAALTPSESEAFLSDWKPVSFSRNEVLTQPGDIERHLYVMISGVHAIYLLDRNGNRVVIGFAFDGSYSGVYDSFVFQQPAAYFLQSLTPSHCYAVRSEHYEAWFDRFPGFDRWGRLAHGHILFGRLQRELELTTLTSEERFVRFMRRCPAPLRAIPQKWLASYLNMTPETFSRLMNSVTW